MINGLEPYDWVSSSPYNRTFQCWKLPLIYLSSQSRIEWFEYWLLLSSILSWYSFWRDGLSFFEAVRSTDFAFRFGFVSGSVVAVLFAIAYTTFRFSIHSSLSSRVFAAIRSLIYLLFPLPRFCFLRVIYITCFWSCVGTYYLSFSILVLDFWKSCCSISKHGSISAYTRFIRSFIWTEFNLIDGLLSLPEPSIWTRASKPNFLQRRSIYFCLSADD